MNLISFVSFFLVFFLYLNPNELAHEVLTRQLPGFNLRRIKSFYVLLLEAILPICLI